MAIASANDCRFEYESTGDGPTVVFIHGENHGREMFDEQVTRFQERFRCVTYARRGHGGSEAPMYGYSHHNQVLDFADLVDTLGLDEMVVVAVAMSTPIAVSYTLDHPERVRALVLVSWYELDGYPAVEERRKQTHPMSFPQLNMMLDEVQRTTGKAGLLRFIQQEAGRLFPIFPETPEVSDRLVEMFAEQPPGRYVHAAEYYTSLPNLIPEMHRLTCPILGICGSADPSPDRPELLDDLPNFRQAWIPGARRFTLMEEPTHFNALLAEFLASLPRLGTVDGQL